MATATPAEQAQIAELETILFRLAAIEDSIRFEAVVERALPGILRMFLEPQNTTQHVRHAIVAVLEHIGSRAHTIRLPVREMIDMMLKAPSSNAAPVNPSTFFLFTIVFIEKGWKQLTQEEQHELGPQLMHGIHKHQIGQQRTLLHLFLQSLAGWNYLAAGEEKLRQCFSFAQVDADREVVLLFIMDLMLYTPHMIRTKASQNSSSAAPALGGLSSSISSSSDAITSNSTSESVPAEMNGDSVAIPNQQQLPEGMSLTAVSTVTDNGKLADMPVSSWVRLKLQALDWVQWSGMIDENEIIPIAIVASISGSHEAVKLGDDILKRMRTLRFEAPKLISRLYSLYLGNADLKGISSEEKRSPASVSLRTKLISFLIKSYTAATMVSHATRVVFDALFSTSSNYRLKQGGLQMCSWIISKAPLPLFTAVSQVLLNALLKFLGTLPKPAHGEQRITGLDSYMGVLRGDVYNVIGQLAFRKPDLVSKNVGVLQLFFDALENESDDAVLQNVHEGLSLTREAYSSNDKPAADQLEALILRGTASSDRRFRLNCLQCANRLFPFDHIPSRFICLQMVNDPSIDVRDEARRGLEPYDIGGIRALSAKRRVLSESARERELAHVNEAAQHQLLQSDSNTTHSVGADIADPTDIVSNSESEIHYPSFVALIRYIRGKFATADLAAFATLDGTVLMAIINFSWACLQKNADQRHPSILLGNLVKELVNGMSDDDRDGITSYRQMLEAGLEHTVGDVQVSSADFLYQLVSSQPALFSEYYSARLDWLKKKLFSSNTAVRISISKLLQLIAPTFDVSVLYHLISEFSIPLQRNERVFGSSDIMHGAIIGLGVIVSTALQKIPDASHLKLCSDALRLIVARLEGEQVFHDTQLAAASCIAVSHIAMAGCLPLPLGHVSILLFESKNTSNVTSILPSSSDESTLSSLTRADVVKRLFALTKGTQRKLSRLVEESIEALSRIAIAEVNGLLVKLIVIGLFRLSNLKHEEIHFSVGEALSQIGIADRTGLVHASDDTDASSVDTSSLSAESNKLRKLLPQLQLSDLLNSMVVCISQFYLVGGNLLQRNAAIIWLLMIMKNAASKPAIQNNAVRIQGYFISALGEKEHLSQECAGKAMAILYEQSGFEVRKLLLEGLQHRFNIRSASNDGIRTERGDNDVSAMPSDATMSNNSESDEFSTYRELCIIASEMNHPELVYKFLDIAGQHSMWISNFGSSFALSSEAAAHQALAPVLHKLVPRLYRYTHDPNERIKSTMTSIWDILVSNKKTIISENFNSIMEELVRACGSRSVRTRISGMFALMDVLHGRTYSDIQPYFEDLWLLLFRLIDDLSDPARKAATSFSVTMHNLTVRFCDPQFSEAKDIMDALKRLVPLLIHKGLANPAKEVQAVSMRCIISLIKHAARFMQPHLPELVQVLLEGMSSIEPTQFAYLQFHAQSYDTTDEDIEQARLNFARTSPLADALGCCLQLVDAKTIEPVVRVLTDLLRSGVGLPTLTGAARAIIILCGSPAAQFIKDLAPSLLGALRNGCVDESPTVRKMYADAIGHVCRRARPKDTERIVHHLLDLYNGAAAQGGTDRARIASGNGILSLLHNCGDNMKSIIVPLVAPIAFLASNDPDLAVAKTWTEVWEEISSNSASASVAWQESIVQTSIAILDSQHASWQLKATTLTSLVKLTKTNKNEFAAAVPKLLPHLLEMLPGRLWINKEVLLELIGTIVTESAIGISDANAKAILESVKRECERTKLDYKKEAIHALGQIAVAFPSFDVFGDARSILANIFEQSAPELSNRQTFPDTSSDGDDVRRDVRLQIYAYDCLGQAWPRAHYNPWSDNTLSEKNPPIWWQSHRDNAEWMIATLLQGMSGANPSSVQVAALRAAKRFIEHIWLGINGCSLPACVSAEQVAALVCGILPCMQDLKHAVVRVAAMEAVLQLLQRPQATNVLALSEIRRIDAQVEIMKQDKDSAVLRLVPTLRAATIRFTADDDLY